MFFLRGWTFLNTFFETKSWFSLRSIEEKPLDLCRLVVIFHRKLSASISSFFLIIQLSSPHAQTHTQLLLRSFVSLRTSLLHLLKFAFIFSLSFRSFQFLLLLLLQLLAFCEPFRNGFHRFTFPWRILARGVRLPATP